MITGKCLCSDKKHLKIKKCTSCKGSYAYCHFFSIKKNGLLNPNKTNKHCRQCLLKKKKKMTNLTYKSAKSKKLSIYNQKELKKEYLKKQQDAGYAFQKIHNQYVCICNVISRSYTPDMHYNHIKKIIYPYIGIIINY